MVSDGFFWGYNVKANYDKMKELGKLSVMVFLFWACFGPSRRALFSFSRTIQGIDGSGNADVTCASICHLAKIT